MNLRQLEVFVAVAEHASFSKAALATHVTQSTVSQHIAALERELGLELLERGRRGVAPTSAGKLLLQGASRVLGAARDAELALRRYRGLEAAPLRVGGSNIPGNYIIPAILSRLLGRFPGLEVSLLVGDSRETLARLLADEIELAVIGTRFSEEKLRFIRVGEERISLVVAARHRWAARQRVGIGELAAEPLIAREPGSGTGRTVEDAFRRGSLDPAALRVTARLGSNEAVKQAVIGGLGVSWISELSCRHELASGELVAVRVRGLEITRSFYLAQRTGNKLSPPARAFASELRASRPTLGANRRANR